MAKIDDITREYFGIYGNKFISEFEFAEFIFSHMKPIIDINNADEFICECRKISWKLYQNIEDMILVPKRKMLADISADQTVPIREWKEHTIKCIQSVQQARKSRGGKSLEYLMSMILKYNNIEHYLQNHNNIKGDIIIPSKDGYIIIECKTTLRERWEQILRSKTQTRVIDVFIVTCIEKVIPEKIMEIQKSGLKIFVPFPIQKDENLSINTMITELKYSTQYYKCIDLFCGAGGLSGGFENSGIKSLVGIEIDEIFANTYISNGDRQVINKNICQVRKIDIDKYIRGKIDIIIGGPNCQGFSMAGGRDPKDPRNSLFREYCRILGYYQPKIFVMENVVGILSLKMEDGNKVFDIILEEFDKMGYNVKYSKLNSADYGVPQKRMRIIIVGVHKSIKSEYHFPSPTHQNPEIKNINNSLPNWIPIRDVLLSRENVDESYFHSQKMIDGFNSRKITNKANGKGFGIQIANMDKPSYTISARYYKDGSDCIVKYSDTCMRKLTELEVSRIQTFPDNYIFKGSKAKIYTQIGNAVPVLLAKCIGDSVKTFLDKLSIEENECYESFMNNYTVSWETVKNIEECDEDDCLEELQSYTMEKLKLLCKERNIIGISKLRKAELIERLKNNT